MAATRSPASRWTARINEVRAGRILITLIVGAALQLAALRLPLPPFSGADLGDPTQRIYALNIWQETQTSVVLLLVFLPWLLHALVWKGSRWGGRILTVVALAGTVAGIWLTLLSIEGYRALPQSVTGIVARVDGRQLWLRDRAHGVYLVVTDADLTSARAWLKPGVGIRLWVSPRGHAGYATRADAAT